MRVSLLIPCYNEEASLPILRDALYQVMKDRPAHTYELIFIDDGSRDGTLGFLEAWASQDEHVHYISFSRNFGKESAMYAGLEAASGDVLAILDADMQDPHRFFRACSTPSKPANLTWSPPGASRARASRRSGVFSRGDSTRSSIECPMSRLLTGPGISE